MNTITDTIKNLINEEREFPVVYEGTVVQFPISSVQFGKKKVLLGNI
jgi:hypothetical protein